MWFTKLDHIKQNSVHVIQSESIQQQAQDYHSCIVHKGVASANEL